jgi:hypothetical protein
VYFNLNKYDKASEYYSKIKNYNQLDINQSIKALLYSQDLKIDNLSYLSGEILSYNLSDEEQFYYTNSLTCVQDFKSCRVKYNEYFESKVESIETGSGEIQTQSSVTLPELLNIKSAIENYENFQLDDLSYKSALISGAYFQNELYPVAIATSKDTLITSPDYRPLIKIIAKSYYEM